jgi:hypothetical protein
MSARASHSAIPIDSTAQCTGATQGQFAEWIEARPYWAYLVLPTGLPPQAESVATSTRASPGIICRLVMAHPLILTAIGPLNDGGDAHIERVRKLDQGLVVDV